MEKLKALRELRRELGAEVFLAGGSVRDLIRKMTPNDLDLVVRNVKPSDFQDFLRTKGSLELVGKSFGVYIFKPKGVEGHVDIAFPRTEVSTGDGHRDFAMVSEPSISLKEDSNRRDFTLNAMYLSIDDINDKGRFDKKAIIDFHQGLEHIRRRLVIAVGNPEDRIKEDAVRMMRAMTLIARTGYRLEGNVFGAIKRHAELLRTASPERIRDELVKIMQSDKPSRAFKVMSRTGVLEVVLPELADCVGCGQNPKYHSYPVFEHLIYAIDAACSISDRLDVRFGALCHDLGKAPTREVRPGGDGPNDVSFHNHEIVSTKLAYKFMRRLKFPKSFIEEVVHLVRWHQYKYDRDWTDKAVRRFIRNCEIERADLDKLDEHPQFLLRQADRMGNQLKAHLPITQKQRDFQERLREVYEKSSAHSLRDLKLNGDDVKAEFELPGSPLIGAIIKHLFSAVEEDPGLNTKEQLIELARTFIEEAESAGDHQANFESSEASEGTVG
jgi:tRNA nucleotidyltransferase (CCA-adding enzyme)